MNKNDGKNQNNSSNNRRPAETGGCITVLSGSSNNETIEDNITNLSFAQPPTNIQTQALNSNSKNYNKKQILINRMYDAKSAEITRRSQSGDGCKIQNNAREKQMESILIIFYIYEDNGNYKKSQQYNKSLLIQNQQSNGIEQPHADRASYISFFNNPKEMEFLTKTIGIMPNSNNQKKLGSNQKSQIKSKRKLISTGEKQQAHSKINQSLSNTRANKNQSHGTTGYTQVTDNNQLITTQGSQNNYPQFFKSFQNFPYPTASSATGNINTKYSHQKITENYNSNSQLKLQNSSASKKKTFQMQSQPTSTTNSNALFNNKFMKSLKAFTQNYFGQQQEKKKKKITNRSKANIQPSQQQSKRERSEPHLMNHARTNENTQSQMKFGQIMEELERFSLSNQNHYETQHNINNQCNTTQMGMLDIDMGSALDINTQNNLLEDSIAQSSVMESELEYTGHGNIRASTYKRNAETMNNRNKLMHYKSEERKNESNFFSQEYLEKIYVNDRVEMELSEFKKEIEQKFEKSDLRNYKFIKESKKPISKVQPYEVKNQGKQSKSIIESNKMTGGKAMFQNFMKQSFDNHQSHYKTKIDSNNYNLITEDRLDREFNSLTQMTFDNNMPQSFKTSYLGPTNGHQTVIKEQSQIVKNQKANAHPDKLQNQKFVQNNKTPKNYSLQLNQKILSDNSKAQINQDNDISSGYGMITQGQPQVNNFTELGTLNEPAFYTTYQNNPGKHSSLGNQIEFLTKDSRLNNNNIIDTQQNNRFSRSNSSSRGGTRSKKREHSKKRSESNIYQNSNFVIYTLLEGKVYKLRTH